MDRKYLVAGFFFGVLLLLLYVFLQILQPFYFVLFWAATLAIVFYPVQRLLERWTNGRKNLAAAVVTFLVVLVLVIPLTVVATTLGAEIARAYERFRGVLSQENMESRLADFLKMFPEEWHGFAKEKLGIETLSRTDKVEEMLAKAAKAVVTLIPTGAMGFIKGIAYLAMLVLTVFFFVRDGPGMVMRIKAVIPLKEDQKDRVLSRFYETLNSVIMGVLITAAIQGGLISLLLYALNIPFPILAGLITFIGATLPIGGASLVWLPGSIILFLVGETWRAVVLLAVGALVISSIDNIVKPMIIGGKAKLPTLFLFLTILGGIRLFGFTGILLGPVILAILLSLIDIYRREYQS